MIVVSVRRQSRPRSFDLVNRLEQPLAPCIGELNFPDLLSGINDERIWHANFHLIFYKSAIGEGLDHMGGVDPSTRRWPAAILQLHGHDAVRGSHQAVWFAGDAQSI